MQNIFQILLKWLLHLYFYNSKIVWFPVLSWLSMHDFAKLFSLYFNMFLSGQNNNTNSLHQVFHLSLLNLLLPNLAILLSLKKLMTTLFCRGWTSNPIRPMVSKQINIFQKKNHFKIIATTYQIYSRINLIQEHWFKIFNTLLSKFKTRSFNAHHSTTFQQSTNTQNSSKPSTLYGTSKFWVCKGTPVLLNIMFLHRWEDFS